jgi:hypothetical protein
MKSPVNPMHWFSWTWFSRNISTSFSILVRSLCIFYNNFYCTLFVLSPIDKAWSQDVHGCSYNDIGCPVIEVNSL